MEEPSSKRRKPNIPEMIFKFQLNKATPLLKHSIRSLCDSEFNPNGVGSLKVSVENGVEILVQNSQTQVIGYLNLQLYGLHNFHCKKPISNYMINLKHVSQILFYAAKDNDAILIFLVDGSTNISLIFSSDPGRTFLVKLLQMNDGNECKEFPYCKFFGVTVFATEVLRQMIERLKRKGRHQLVSVEITDALVTIFVGLLSHWLIKYDDDEEMIKVRKYAEGQKHHAWFQLHHLKSLKKASFLAPRLKMCLLCEPSNSIVLLFKLDKLGRLVFMNSAIKLSTFRKPHEQHDCTAAVAPPTV